jgi:beta-glucosidase
MEDFIAQLSEDDLSAIIRGEGMGSPKVTPGTAAAFGGISRSLNAFGIPCGCCTDGPSGMRMDSGAKAFSLPNGTLLACTFNLDLVEELFTFTGVEMVKNKIDRASTSTGIL